MHVIIELQTGADSGKRRRLAPNQSLEVGRSGWSDFPVPDDGELAETHFRLVTDSGSCWLASAPEAQVTVNGEPVQRAVLTDGDLLAAGRSRFLVRIEGGAAPSAEAAAGQAGGARRLGGAASAPPLAGEVSETRCDTGAWRGQAACEALPPAAVAARLAARLPLHAVVDLRRAELDEPPAEEQQMHYLFDWLGPAARDNSPAYLGPGEVTDVEPLVEAAWGQNALVCLFSQQAAGEMLATLRRLARPSADQVVGVCWPALLNQILAHQRGSLATNLLAAADAILVEDGEAADHWSLYSAQPLKELLEPIGLTVVAPPPPTADS